MKEKLVSLKGDFLKYKKVVLKVTSAIMVIAIVLSQIYFYMSGYEKIADFYSYYTMLVTLLAAIVLFISLFKDINIKIFFIVTIDVAIMLLIAPAIIPGFSVALFTLHFLAPVYLFIYLFLYYDIKELNDYLSIKDIKYILAFPALYLILVVTRGIMVNRFPYSFVEFSSQGIISIIIFFLILVGIFITIYFILYNVITSKYKHRYSILSFTLITGILLLYIFISDIVRTEYNNSNINYNSELFYIGEYNNKSLYKGYKDEGCYLIDEEGNYEKFQYKNTCLDYDYHSNNYLYNFIQETNELSVYNPLDNNKYEIDLELSEGVSVKSISLANGYLYLKTFSGELLNSSENEYANLDLNKTEYTFEKYDLQTMTKQYSFSNINSDFRITMFDTYYKMTIYGVDEEKITIDKTTITKPKESYIYYDINTLKEVDVKDIVKDKNDIEYLGVIINQDDDYIYTYYFDKENTFKSDGDEYISFYIFKYDLNKGTYTYLKIPYKNGFRYSTSYYYGDRLYGRFYIDRVTKTDSNTIILIEPQLDEISYYEINLDLEVINNVDIEVDYNRLIVNNSGNILAVATYRDIYSYRYSESIRTTYLDLSNNLRNEIFDYSYYI